MSAAVLQTTSTVSGEAVLAHLPQLLPLLRELNDLKRVRVAGTDGSLAEQLFARSWQALVAGEDATTVALRETARALVAVRLPGYTVPLLTSLGMSEEDAEATLQLALTGAGASLAPELLTELQAAWMLEALQGSAETMRPATPTFVAQLAAQPRAGATHPGRPRIMLVPTESHADHCALVAVYAVLLSPTFQAEPGEAFLTALTHHLHNAALPDPGFAGDELLSHRLPGLMQQATTQALAQLPGAVRRTAEAALLRTRTLDNPAAKAFHAADVFDRTLEMAWHDQSARFRLYQALDDLNIVHAGFTQTFHQQVLSAAGLLPTG
ncbi:hypothetical protein [uncultured Hymenobacter sp.]|uniref:hypothetical protein n=1 Tax=uncultured Hymenobacter sp. TaxID=170016 RepID=UPI0035C95CF5